MGAESLFVWVDHYERFELAGTIAMRESGLSFSYAGDYKGPPIAHGMPVGAGSISPHRSETFFGALVPEGEARLDFLRLLRAGRGEWLPFLQRLSDESSGVLAFSLNGEPPGRAEAYVPVDGDYFEELGRDPGRVATDTLDSSRVSVAGAMRKVGLYRSEQTGAWYQTRGAAPTTHIVKVPNEQLFPLETINEAICLTVAGLCGLETEEFELIATGSGALLAARRFDRPLPDEPALIGGLARPRRLHQEDLCQLGDTPIKYEPSGAHYLSFATRLIRGACENAFGESMGLLCLVFLDYLVGSCDNHLKNFSVLYDEGMRSAVLSPAYDVLDTTVYARVATEIGISLSPSRKIVGVTRDDLVGALGHAGFPTQLALGEFECVRDDALRCFPQACEIIAAQGFAKEVERLAGPMERGLRARARFTYREEDRHFLDVRGLGARERK